MITATRGYRRRALRQGQASRRPAQGKQRADAEEQSQDDGQQRKAVSN